MLNEQINTKFIFECAKRLDCWLYYELIYTKEKDLIELKKITRLKDFIWFKKMIYLNELNFFWFKQSIFESNKNWFKSNKFLPWSKKLYIWPYMTAIICLCWKQFIRFKQILIRPKNIFLKLNKCYLIQMNFLFESKRDFQTNYFLPSSEIFFLSIL